MCKCFKLNILKQGVNRKRSVKFVSMRKKQIIVLGVVMGAALLGLIFMQAKYFQTAFQQRRAEFDYLVNKSMDEVVSYIDERGQKYSNTVRHESLREVGDKLVHSMPISLGVPQGASIDNMNIIIDYADSPLGYGENEFSVGNVFGQQGQDGGLLSSIEKSRQALKERLGKDYDLVVVNKGEERQARNWDELLKTLDLKQLIGTCLKANGVEAAFEYAVKDNGQVVLTSPNFFDTQSEYAYSCDLGGKRWSTDIVLFLIFPEVSHDLLSSIFLLLPSLFITFLLILCSALCMMEIVKQKKLSAIKNDFINNMTHEFKTPIATISLAAEMLKDGAVNNSRETIDHIAGIIRDESKRLTFQVEKVLQTALFTETRMKLKLKKVNLNEIVESLASKFSLRVEDRGGKLFCYPEAECDEIYADEVHITNVISNLLDNAIKYCEKIPEISIYTKNHDDEIVVSVIDNGIGIAAKEQKLIFERFYRVSTGNLHNVKGFGLGLSYVKTIVEAHGGRIKVESEEGKGSRFDVFLPLVVKKQVIKKTLCL